MGTLQPNAELCRHKCMAVARGVATIKPDEPFLVKFCNFVPDLVMVRKGSTVAFAEPDTGQMLTVSSDEENPPLKEVIEETRNTLEEIALNDGFEYLHKQIKDMLAKQGRIRDGSLRVIHATEHAIVTLPGTVPIRAQPYRTGAFKRAIIVDQISKILHLKVITASHSVWASPVVIVPRKNGKARFCVDYRRLNNITEKDAYPLPCMEICLDSLGDAKVFTSLD
eukprot:contig_1726_g271